MVAVIERLAEDFRRLAPELLASPKASLFRIYRDTRFSEDKSPLKTHVSAVFPRRDLGRLEGACLYLEVAPDRVLFAGGLHAPATPQLQFVREHVARHHRRLHRIVESPAFRRTAGPLEGDMLQRVPRGFPRDHPAADYLRHREFVAWRERPSSFAADPRFYAELLRVFRHLVPLVRFLNEPLVGRVKDPLLAS